MLKSKFMIKYDKKSNNFMILKNNKIIWAMLGFENLKKKAGKLDHSILFLNYIYFLHILIDLGLIYQNCNKNDYRLKKK